VFTRSAHAASGPDVNPTNRGVNDHVETARQTGSSVQPCKVMEELRTLLRALMSRDPRFDGWFFTAVNLDPDLLPAELARDHTQA